MSDLLRPANREIIVRVLLFIQYVTFAAFSAAIKCLLVVMIGGCKERLVAR